MENSKIYAPICLFTFNRPRETKEVLEALSINKLAKYSKLYIFQDGPRSAADNTKIQEVIKVCSLYQNDFKEVVTFISKENKGLAKSIIKGVTSVIEKYGKIIVLEDDIVVSNNFLQYMNDSLNYYEKYEDVMQISSFMFPIDDNGLPDTFFYQANTCWGWGTWHRSWKYYNDDVNDLIKHINEKKVSWNDFNSLQGNEFKKQLYNNKKGVINTWAVKWHAVIKLMNGKVLHPRKTLVANIGFSGNGENCKKGDVMGSSKNNLYLDVKQADELDNREALNRLKKYFKKRYSYSQKLKRYIKRYG